MRLLNRFSDVRLAGDCSAKEQAIRGTGRLIEGVKRGARRLRALVRCCCFWAPIFALSACATFDVTPFLKEQITGDTWRACLAREYQVQARFQARYGRNWDEAIHLAQKGRQALNHSDITPDDWPEILAPQANAYRDALSQAGKTCACATLQAKLDGWTVVLAQDPAREQSQFASSVDTALAACQASGPKREQL